MSVVIDNEIIERIGMSETELKREIAIYLFREKKLTIGRASEFAGMNLIQFRRLLASRRISLGYGVREFREDIKTLQEMGRL
ncbi:MAG: UPF0175 family protein [Hormoscilla sp. GUM202]|nr:UPF0175 family protein [Hormoscilla sp. GUM202]